MIRIIKTLKTHHYPRSGHSQPLDFSVTISYISILDCFRSNYEQQSMISIHDRSMWVTDVSYYTRLAELSNKIH